MFHFSQTWEHGLDARQQCAKVVGKITKRKLTANNFFGGSFLHNIALISAKYLVSYISDSALGEDFGKEGHLIWPFSSPGGLQGKFKHTLPRNL